MTFPEDRFPDGTPAEPAAQKVESAEKPLVDSRKSFLAAGCAIAALAGGLCVAALLVVGVIFGLASMAGGSFADLESLGSLGSGGKTFSEEYISGGKSSSDKIAVIDVKGVISSAPATLYEVASSELIREQLKAACEDSSVKAVIINLDTPGGEVTASDEIHHEILKLKAAHKPVVAMMNSMAASGGYYVAVACDSIVANKLTLTGSIGVIIEGYNYAELFNKIGLKSEVYKSGPMKDMLDGSRPRTEEEKVIVQRLVDNTYDDFLSVVSNGRKIPMSQLRGKPITDGRVLDGKQALEVNLVDKLGYFEDAVSEASRLAKVQDCKVIRYVEAFSLSKLMERMSSKNSKAMKISIGGAEAQGPELKRGCLYFLPTNW